MLGWIAIIVGILVLLGVCWYYRKTIKSMFKKHKRKITAVAVAGGMIGVGGSGIIIPEGYRPNLDTMIHNSNGKYWEAIGSNIQAAIDDLGSDGGTVWLPGNTVFISASEITMSSNINLIGSGKSTIIQRGCTDANAEIMHLWDDENILIENIAFYGDASNANGHGGNGIEIGKSSNVTIRNCFIRNISHNGIFVKTGCKNINIEDNVIGDLYRDAYPGGVMISGSYCRVVNNYFYDCYACGIILEDNSFKNGSYNIISNNEITGTTSHGVHEEKGSGISHNNKIINNYIHDLNSTAYVSSTSHWSKGIILGNNSICSGNTIEHIQDDAIDAWGNCTITNNIITNITDGRGIEFGELNGYAVAVITNNRIKYTGGEGIGIVYSSDIRNNVTVCNNILREIGLDGIASQASGVYSNNYLENIDRYGIYNGGSNRYITVGNNIIINSKYAIHTGAGYYSACGNNIKKSEYGIFSNSKNATYVGNFIEDITYDGIRLHASESNTVITGNHIHGANRGIRQNSETASGLISNNILSDCNIPVSLVSSSNITIKDNIGYNYDSLQDGYIWNSNGKYWGTDGTADDVQIQAAMDDLSGTGGTVWLPPGTFDLADDIDIVSHVNLVGSGMDTTILKMSDTFGAQRYGIKVSSGSPHNFSIQDLTVDADEQDFYSCMFIDSSTNVLLKNIHVTGASLSNLYISGMCKRLTLENVHSSNICSPGSRNPMQAITFSQVYDSNMNGIYAYDIDDVDVVLDWGNCNNVSVNNVYVDATGAPLGTKGIKIAASESTPSKNLNFNNIIVKGITGDTTDNGRALYIENAVTNSNFNNIVLEDGGAFYIGKGTGTPTTKRLNINNVCVNNTIIDSDAWGFNILNAEDITLSNIETNYCYARAIYMQDSNNITVTNGKFIGGEYASALVGCEDITFDMCTFKDNKNAARTLELQDSNNLSILGCRFLNNVGDGIATNYGAVGAQYYVINGCTFRNNLKGIDLGTHDDNFIITDNIFFDDTCDAAPGGSTSVISDNIGI